MGEGGSGDPALDDALLRDLLLRYESSDGEHGDPSVVELRVLVLDLLGLVLREETEGVPAVVSGDGVGLHFEGVGLGRLEGTLGLQVNGCPLLGGNSSLGSSNEDKEGDERSVVELLELLEGVDGVDVDGALHHGVVELGDDEAEAGHHGDATVLELGLAELYEGGGVGCGEGGGGASVASVCWLEND